MPPGLLNKIEAAANGFRTKRDVVKMFESQGLTYLMLLDLAEGRAEAVERKKIKTCRYSQ